MASSWPSRIGYAISCSCRVKVDFGSCAGALGFFIRRLNRSMPQKRHEKLMAGSMALT
jgi:hypothetical protein